MQPRVVNTAPHSGSAKEALTLRTPVTIARAPQSATVAQKVQRPHLSKKATRAAATSTHDGSAGASTRSSDSGASTSSVPARAPLRRSRPPPSRLATPGAPRNAAPPLGKGRGAAGLHSHEYHVSTGVGSPPTAGAEGACTSSSSHSFPDELDMQLRATWREKRRRLERDVQVLSQYSHQLIEETRAVEDSIERMLTEFEDEKRRVEVQHTTTVAHYLGLMNSLRGREEACLAAKQQALDRICMSQEMVCQLQQEQDAKRDAINLATEERDRLEQQLAATNSAAEERAVNLQRLQQEEDRMKDVTYGLSGEVKEMVLEMERLRGERHRIDVQSMENEMTRRELYSLCEELKGSIRVYCRVKGSTRPVDAPCSSDVTACDEAPAPQLADSPKPADMGTLAEESAEVNTNASGTMPPLCRPPSRSGSPESSLSANLRAISRSSTSTRAAVVAADAQRNGGGGGGGGGGARSSIATASVIEDSEADTTVDEGAAPVFSFPDRGGAGDLREATRSVRPGGLSSARGVTPTASTGDTMSASNHAGTPLFCTSVVPSEAEAEEPRPVAPATVVAGLPYGCGRGITIHQTRSNATSTGLSSFTETFVYDRVFTGEARQEEVYADVEPLVRNAVDGYRVCIFAYGQTGSGKTFTMEGDVRGRPEMYGVTPRALQTILHRQAELADEGWSYELSCTFVEIYNDVIRDLFQSGSMRYEAAIQQQQQQQQQQQTSTTTPSSTAAHHTIKHIGDRTSITNAVERRIGSMEEFLQLYKHAVLQRSTTKTELNDASSRSHCVFTLNIVGTNPTIRQRSDGVLCLVDLAGSERVNESGVQGKHFKEAVNINRSLLDLGKCIRALRCGAVVPWRNCKLTYLLQNYLGAKGGKMLMIVTVSNAKAHVPESLNSLRFAARVQETYVGTSVKRLTSI
ncbi:hypothetical protein JKF63_03608 [Porcisia hertigi]|uniref:Kinesin-like protein n=1 Tax=Porcisia hertigi TaxID=2761500 RepID=A0A836I027_9TRYP|nr:hypothetical protein JKF63_03608 [Porcisia hertigi]